jgi:hypothetical protein
MVCVMKRQMLTKLNPNKARTASALDHSIICRSTGHAPTVMKQLSHIISLERTLGRIQAILAVNCWQSCAVAIGVALCCNTNYLSRPISITGCSVPAFVSAWLSCCLDNGGRPCF